MPTPTEDDDSDFRKRSFGAAAELFEEDRKHWDPFRAKVSYLVSSNPADVVMGCIITVNAVFVVLETNYKGLEQDLPTWLNIATTILLGIYTLELLVRLFVYRKLFFYNSWNLFDFTVVSVDIICELISRIFEAVVPSVSVLRVFRILRLLRFVEMLTIFSELHMMVKLMIASLRTMFWGTILLTITITLWSIVAVEYLHPLNRDLAKEGRYDGCERCARAFETVYQANLTFFQQLVFGDSWGTTSVVLIEAHPWTGIILVAAGVTLQVGLLNLILTVIVDKATEQHQADHKKQLQIKEDMFLKAKATLIDVCGVLDGDGSGDLELGELLNGFETNEDFAKTLALMDIRADDMHVVFEILDEDQSGTVDYKEFVDQLYKMKSQDSQTMLLFIKGYVNDLRGKVNEQMKMLKSVITDKLDEIKDLAGTNAAQRAAETGGPNSSPALQAAGNENGIPPGAGAGIPPGAVGADGLQRELEMCTQKLNGVAGNLDAKINQTFQQLQMSIAALSEVGEARGSQSGRFFQTCEVVKPARSPAALTPTAAVRTPIAGSPTMQGPFNQGSPDGYGAT